MWIYITSTGYCWYTLNNITCLAIHKFNLGYISNWSFLFLSCRNQLDPTKFIIYNIDCIIWIYLMSNFLGCKLFRPSK